MDKKQQVPSAMVTDISRCSTPLTFMGCHNAWLMWKKLRVERGCRVYFIKNKWICKLFFPLAVYFSELLPCKLDFLPLHPPWTQWDISEQILHCMFGLPSFNIRKRERNRCLFCYSYFRLFCQQTMFVFKKSELRTVSRLIHVTSLSSENAIWKEVAHKKKNETFALFSAILKKIIMRV